MTAEVMRVYMTNLRKIRRAERLCPMCGGAPDPDHITCPTCLAKQGEAQRRYRQWLYEVKG